MNDVTQSIPLVSGLSGSAVGGDRAYDSNVLISFVEAQQMKAVIPSRTTRREQRPTDAAAYALRNVIERLFGRIKAFRRVATRYEKTAVSYSAVLAFAFLLVELSGWAT